MPALIGECEAYPGSELIIVDNASGDNSADWIEAYYPQVRILRNRQNVGFAAACNQGAAASSGNVLVFLNQDTEVLSGWLKALVEGLTRNASVGLTTSKLLYMTQKDKINLCGQDVHYTGLVFGHGTLCASDAFIQAQEVGAVSGASFAIWRLLWEQLKGFDETFFMYYEETDLCWRAGTLGYSSWYIPESISYHDANIKPSPAVMYYAARNRVKLVLKQWKLLTLIILLPSFFLSDFIDWIYRIKLGGSYVSAKLHACGWLLANTRWILKARREAQAGRQVSDASLLQKCTPVITPRAMYLGAIGQGWIRMANLLFMINYRAALKLTQWLKI